MPGPGEIDPAFTVRTRKEMPRHMHGGARVVVAVMALAMALGWINGAAVLDSTTTSDLTSFVELSAGDGDSVTKITAGHGVTANDFKQERYHKKASKRLETEEQQHKKASQRLLARFKADDLGEESNLHVTVEDIAASTDSGEVRAVSDTVRKEQSLSVDQKTVPVPTQLKSSKATATKIGESSATKLVVGRRGSGALMTSGSFKMMDSNRAGNSGELFVVNHFVDIFAGSCEPILEPIPMSPVAI